MEINKNMFREYDIRGVYGVDINEEISYLVGRAFGTKLLELGKKQALVGYDNRISSPTIEENLVQGIIDTGVDVVRLGLVTTPMYYYGWELYGIKAGVMITASHNPKEYNGFKISYNGIHNAYGQQIKELYDIIEKRDFIEGKGTIEVRNLKKEYINLITSGIQMGDNRIKVVYDCGNGTTCVVADEIFDSFSDKIDFIPLFNVSDPEFPNHHPDPFVEENLVKLKEKVLETGAIAGIAFDGDGDRIGVVDHNGKMLDIDKFMILIWRNICDKVENKRTMFDVKCSKALEDELKKLGVQGDCYRTGNSYTKAYSAEYNLPFSGELSGHVYFRDRFIGSDDGIYAGLRLVEILSNTNKNIEQLLNNIPTYYSTKELKISIDDSIKFKVINQVKEYCIEREYKILTIDGVKVLFDDGFALIRASNTGPNITYRYEAKSKDRLVEIETEFNQLLKRLTLC